MKLLIISLICIYLINESNATCKYWCRKPMSFDYVCCDKGNPFIPALESSSVSESLAQIDITTTAAAPLQEVAPSDEKKSCRYFCVYNAQVYCCDDGSSPLPADHMEHDGRCPAKKEQVCKKGGIYLHIHASKMTTKKGSKKLSHKGIKDDHPVCASDGYCEEDEKCCENLCAKKHTCMKSVYDYDGTRKTVPKKKRTRNY